MSAAYAGPITAPARQRMEAFQGTGRLMVEAFLGTGRLTMEVFQGIGSLSRGFVHFVFRPQSKDFHNIFPNPERIDTCRVTSRSLRMTQSYKFYVNISS